MVQLPQELIPGSIVVTIDSLPTLDVVISGTVDVQQIAPSGRQLLYGPAHPEFVGSPPPSPLADLIYAVQATPPQRVEVQQIIVCNTTGSSATFTLSKGAVSPATAFFFEKSVAANATEIFNVIIPLTAGEELHAQQQTSDALTLSVIGEVNNV